MQNLIEFRSKFLYDSITEFCSVVQRKCHKRPTYDSNLAVVEISLFSVCYSQNSSSIPIKGELINLI